MGIVKKAAAGCLMGALLAGSAMAGVTIGEAPFTGAADGQQSDQNSTAFSQPFAAPTGMVLELVRWWGFHSDVSGGASFDNFVVLLDGVAQSGTLSVVPGALFDEYTFDIVDMPLSASSLSIVNDSGDVEWFWQSAAAVGNPGSASADTVAYSLIGRLDTTGGTVDAPATPALLLAAGAGWWCVRRRKTTTA